MGARKSFFPILLLVMIAAFVFGRNYESRRATLGGKWTHEFEDGLQRQKGERKFEPVDLKLSLELESSTEAPLFGPLQLVTGPAGELHVLDTGDFKVKSFSAEGKLLRTLGRGKGEGPGELLSTTDLAIGDDGTLWVADLVNGRLMLFRPDGRDEIRKLETQPYRLALQADGGFFLMFGVALDRVFGRYDSTAKEVGRFGNWLEDQGLNAILLDGWIRRTPAGFVYLGRYSGLLVAFDHQGKPIFSTETVEGAGLPKILQGDGGLSWVDREAAETARSLTLCRDEVVVFAIYEANLKRRGALDRYSSADGRYVGSWPMPGQATSVVCGGDFLYTVRDRSISRWSLPPR